MHYKPTRSYIFCSTSSYNPDAFCLDGDVFRGQGAECDQHISWFNSILLINSIQRRVDLLRYMCWLQCIFTVCACSLPGGNDLYGLLILPMVVSCLASLRREEVRGQVTYYSHNQIETDLNTHNLTGMCNQIS